MLKSYYVKKINVLFPASDHSSGPVHYAHQVGNTVVKATIPSSLLSKAGLLPKKIVNMLNLPSAEHRMLLRIKYGIVVQYMRPMSVIYDDFEPEPEPIGA